MLNADTHAARAYGRHTRTVGSPRDVEHQAFQKVTAQLRAAAEPDADFAQRAEAVHMNTRLWTLLAVDLIAPQNALPEDLRRQLFNLAEFSRKHGMKVLSGAGEISELIEINTMIMRGLRRVGVEPESASA